MAPRQQRRQRRRSSSSSFSALSSSSPHPSSAVVATTEANHRSSSSSSSALASSSSSSSSLAAALLPLLLLAAHPPFESVSANHDVPLPTCGAASGGVGARCTADSHCVDPAHVVGADAPDCGKATCDLSTGMCSFDANVDVDDCYERTYVFCDYDDFKCTKGPRGVGGSGVLGRCDGWGFFECVYYWCPPEEMVTPPPLRCCDVDADCDIPRSSTLPTLSECGEVRCNTDLDRCEFDARSEEGGCKDAYYVYCVSDDGTAGQDDMCDKGPVEGMAGVEGTCSVYYDMECSYSWCPARATATTTQAAATTTAASGPPISTTAAPPLTTTTAAPQTTATATATATTVEERCCNTASDCDYALSPTMPTMSECGDVRCNPVLNRCEFDARSEKGGCYDAYYVYCVSDDGIVGQDDMCTKGPVRDGETGICSVYYDRECTYSWCPAVIGGQTETTTTGPGAVTTTTAVLATTAATAVQTTATVPPTTTTAPLATTTGALATTTVPLTTTTVPLSTTNLITTTAPLTTTTVPPISTTAPLTTTTSAPPTTTTAPPTTTTAPLTTTIAPPTTTTALPTTTTALPTTTTAAAPTTTTFYKCCNVDTDCKADVGRPSLPDCGYAKCNNSTDDHYCEYFTRYDTKDYCNEEYYVECGDRDSACTAGPQGSAGFCDIQGDLEFGGYGGLCRYEWCPGVGPPTTAAPVVLPPVTGGNFWRPAQITTWDWQLQVYGLDYTRDVMVYDVDLWENTKESILNIKTNGGTITDPSEYRKIICYFSAGSWEDWRPDADDFPEEVKGTLYYGFPNESWLDVRRLDILTPIMTKRLDMAVEKGCDAVEPDNMDVYDDTAHESSGFPLSYQDQIDYNVWLSEQAHSRGMACALKNDINQARDLMPYFEFVVSEQCVQYDECQYYEEFDKVGKPVFLCEYELPPEEFCDTANSYKTMAIKKDESGDLGSDYIACPPWWEGKPYPPGYVPPAPGTKPITIDVAEGFAGRAIVISGFGFGRDEGSVYWESYPCTVTSWSWNGVRAYVNDDAPPMTGNVVLVKANGVASVAVPFRVLPPSIVPTKAMADAMDFVRTKMRNAEGGVYTNLVDKTADEEIYLYGHHVTSEHVGLMGWVSAAMLDHKTFEETYRYVETKMVDPTYDVVNWGIDKRDGEPFVYDEPKNLHFNAPLDDFRVVKALISGWMQWGDTRYKDLALRIGKGLVETSVSTLISSSHPDGLVGPGFGWQENPVLTFTENYLCPINYADLWTMRWLSDYDVRWTPVIAETIDLMESAQLPSGQFYNAFLKSTQSYTGDFEYQGDGEREYKIKTIQSLWTSIHLARVGRVDAARRAFDFYREFWYVPRGRIPEYLEPGGVETNLEGILDRGEVRIYSQLARLAYYLGEREFGDEVIRDRVVSAQDTNPNSITFGHLSMFPPYDDSEAYETLEGLVGMIMEKDSIVMNGVFPSPISQSG